MKLKPIFCCSKFETLQTLEDTLLANRKTYFLFLIPDYNIITASGMMDVFSPDIVLLYRQQPNT
jgi:hypothetical protein